MNKPLHDALRDLAGEVDAAPDGLAERAWAAGRTDRRRQRNARVMAALTAAAAAVLVLWIAVMSGLGTTDSAPAEPGPDQVPEVVTGYPQRVVDPGEIEPLPTKGVPLAAVMHSRHRAAEDGGWLALRPDGSVYSLPGLLPAHPPEAVNAPREDAGYTPDQQVPLPSLDPLGRWLAAFERPEGGGAAQLVIIDVVTGERHHNSSVLAGLGDGFRELVGGQCLASVGARLHWRPAGAPRLALACDDGGDRVLDSHARTVLTRPPGGSLGRPTCDRALAGWVDTTRLLSICTTRPGFGERVHLSVFDVTNERVEDGPTGPTKPLANDVGSIRGTAWDERNLVISPARGGARLEIATAVGTAHVEWAETPTITTAAPISRGRIHQASMRQDGGGSPNMARLAASDVTIYTPGYLGVMTLDTPARTSPVTLMVIDPGLGVDSISFAATALHGEVTTHRLGARTSWWSWHPVASGLIGLALLSLAPFAWVMARQRGWPGPSGAATVAVAVLLGVVLAIITAITVVRATQEPDPLPTPGHTVQ